MGSPIVRRALAASLACLLSSALPAPAATRPPKFDYKLLTLDNGLQVVLLEDHSTPIVNLQLWYHVGSRDERKGRTGFAHLFEHMMFKGTPTIGTKDYQKDLEIIAAQERIRDDMRREEAKMRADYRLGAIDDLLKPENKTARYRELEKEFNKLIADQRDVLIKNEFDRIYSGAGGSGMNAFTAEDMTAYFITVPANKLELWMWMESERLWHPVFREFYAERDVVYEERRMRTESTPLGKFAEEFKQIMKALKKFIASLRSLSSPVLLDLGPVVGSNIAFFGEQLGCKIFVEDIFADLDRHHRERRLADLPAFLARRFPQADSSVDGILCWDLFDFLDRAAAQAVASQLSRVLSVNGALFGFFSTAHPRETRLTKFVVVDDNNLRHRPYSTPRMRQAVLQNRDIIRLFERLRVSDSFLLHSNVREILFRKPAKLGQFHGVFLCQLPEYLTGRDQSEPMTFCQISGE